MARVGTRTRAAARSDACSNAQRAYSSTCARSGSWLSTCQNAPVNGSALPASSTVGHGERNGTKLPNDSSTSARQRRAMRGSTRCSQISRPTKPRRLRALGVGRPVRRQLGQRGDQVGLGDEQARVVWGAWRPARAPGRARARGRRPCAPRGRRSGSSRAHFAAFASTPASRLSNWRNRSSHPMAGGLGLALLAACVATLAQGRLDLGEK